MKIINYYIFTILLALILLQSTPKLGEAQNKPGLISRLGMNIGMNFPFGSGVLQKGAYPFGFSSYLIGTHTTTRDHNYEILTGVDIMADYGGGIYLALPVLVNRTHEILNIGNSRFTVDGFAGLGYSFHHIFSRTKGITVKNQHTLGLDAGLTFIIALGKKWEFNLANA